MSFYFPPEAQAETKPPSSDGPKPLLPPTVAKSGSAAPPPMRAQRATPFRLHWASAVVWAVQAGVLGWFAWTGPFRENGLWLADWVGGAGLFPLFILGVAVIVFYAASRSNTAANVTFCLLLTLATVGRVGLMGPAVTAARSITEQARQAEPPAEPIIDERVRALLDRIDQVKSAEERAASPEGEGAYISSQSPPFSLPTRSGDPTPPADPRAALRDLQFDPQSLPLPTHAPAPAAERSVSTVDLLTETARGLRRAGVGKAGDTRALLAALADAIEGISDEASHAESQWDRFESMGGIRLDSFGSHAAVTQRSRQLRQTIAATHTARAMHGDLIDNIERRVAQAGVSTSARQQFLATIAPHVQRMRVVSVVWKLDHQAGVLMLQLLDTLDQEWGRWTVDDSSKIVQFQDPAMADRFNGILANLKLNIGQQEVFVRSLKQSRASR